MDINFFATYQCNSRCLNCSIWKGKTKSDKKPVLDREQLDALFASPICQKSESIGIAGGEPTIDPFFWQLLEAIPPTKKITITTNGLKSRKLIDFLKKQPDKDRFLVQVSLDGIEEVNDMIRGIPGGFQKAVSLLEQFKEIKIKSLISFTINRKNFHQILDVYALAAKYQAGFSARMAYCGGAYDNSQNKALFDFDDDELETLEKCIQQIINGELEKKDHNPAQVVFMDRIVPYYKDRKKQKQIPCKAMETGLVIDLHGEVFPNCPVLMKKKLGNISDKHIDRILGGIEAAEFKAYIDDFKCGGCWNDCQVVTNINLSKKFLYDTYNKIKMRKFNGMIRIPELIDFSLGDFPFLLSGWHPLEKEGEFFYHWTEPRFAIPVPSETGTIDMFVSVHERIVETQDAEITIDIAGMNPVTLGVVTSEWQWIRFELPDKLNDTMIGNVYVNGRFGPGELKHGSDIRKLGMAVSLIRFIKT